ncbi:hypothetical protein SFRURICE_012780 [Spodoptera frugiperda]|nr:hypothetical protein SFRURICE_012780 [Spodoptera frugiperda]
MTFLLSIHRILELRTFLAQLHSLVETSKCRVVARTTAVQGVSGKLLVLSPFRFFENFSVVAQSLELCPVYDIRLIGQGT